MDFSTGTIFQYDTTIAYAEDAVVSKTLIKKDTGTITLFAFDKGQGLSEHTAPFDALIEMIEGKAEISIAQEKYILQKGDNIILPAHIPHALQAIDRFKMVLIMIKTPKV
ncbi:MAG: cupin domain-containing protein [Candidatus Competibacteraceae bacterium]|nr:cupin domain-containing protein [Candidatus Competibacteraceae bacterium]